ncbi:hypothetical protein GBAR_LOCUS12493 [Geodia barretti]|uniref:Uncharacterized protein n=1 Tax=Geodia barretti TaxID=519541 RepID=A0AA35S2G7_GEOBA|nr:hypothetical protein GBAR_LOCUS12493 [Geodia barretti]
MMSWLLSSPWVIWECVCGFVRGVGRWGRERPGGDRAGLRPLLMNCEKEQSEEIERRGRRKRECEGEREERKEEEGVDTRSRGRGEVNVRKWRSQRQDS